MISEVHNTSFVSLWLHEFVRLTGDIPDIYVCDMSQVLLNSAALTFAHCSGIAQYADILFKMHFESNPKVPNCYIRIDKNHFLKHIASCEALKNVSKLQREFYIRSICLLMQCKSLGKAEFILISILTVAKCEFKGEKYLKFEIFVVIII